MVLSIINENVKNLLFHNNNSFNPNLLVSKIQHAQVSLECSRHLYNKNKNSLHILRWNFWHLLYLSDTYLSSKNMFQLALNIFFVFSTTAKLFGAEIGVAEIRQTLKIWPLIFIWIKKETKTNTNLHIWLELSIFAALCNFKFEFWRKAIVGIIKAEWPEVWKKIAQFSEM